MNLKFTDIQKQKIVDAILIGLRNYVDERKKKTEEMLVSDGYAWTRSNHIDTALGNALKEINISYEKKRISGWGYLEFKIENQKTLFLVKSPSFVKSFQDKSSGKKEHYIREFAKSNDSLVESSKFQDRIVQKQLSLDLDQIPNLTIGELDGIDRSYIIVYAIGTAGMVESIKSYLPNSVGELFQVEDLSPYLERSEIVLTDEEKTHAKTTFSEDKAEGTDVFTFEILGDLKEENTEKEA